MQFTQPNRILFSVKHTSEDGTGVDEVTEAGPVPNKDQLPRADLGSVAAAAVEDGLLVEYPARRQGHLVGSRILQR